MKNLWTFFVLGIFCVAIFTAVTKAADDKDPRVSKIDDPNISSVRTKVPLVKEMEAGLFEREQIIKDRELRVKEAEERLAVEEGRIKERIDEFTRLQDEIERKQKENRKINEAMLQRLVKTFETMQPKKASGVISVMKDELAVELLLAMKEKKVAAIMDVMDPNRAMNLSTLVSRRRPAGRMTGGEQAQQQPEQGGPPSSP